jgi:hypothetical protein
MLIMYKINRDEIAKNVSFFRIFVKAHWSYQNLRLV